jgi:hypothetical protein
MKNAFLELLFVRQLPFVAIPRILPLRTAPARIESCQHSSRDSSFELNAASLAARWNICLQLFLQIDDYLSRASFYLVATKIQCPCGLPLT